MSESGYSASAPGSFPPEGNRCRRPAEQSGFFVRHRKRTHKRAQPGMIHRHHKLIADSLKKETLVRLPFSGVHLPPASHPRALGFLVRQNHSQRRFESQFAQDRRTFRVQFDPAESVGRCAGKQVRATAGTKRRIRRRHAGRNKLRDDLAGFCGRPTEIRQRVTPRCLPACAAVGRELLAAWPGGT